MREGWELNRRASKLPRTPLEEFLLFVFRDLKSNFEGLDFAFELAYLRESSMVG